LVHSSFLGEHRLSVLGRVGYLPWVGSMGSTLSVGKTIVSHTIEVSTLSFISDVSDVLKAMSIPVMPINVKQLIIRSAISNSFAVYFNRNTQGNESNTI